MKVLYLALEINGHYPDPEDIKNRFNEFVDSIKEDLALDTPNAMGVAYLDNRSVQYDYQINDREERVTLTNLFED